jgi:ABC-type polysaccharide/polyol phosphate transport system ATPase subunit
MGARSREARLRLREVAKRYGFWHPWVFREVSLEVAVGRLVRFEGRNGSGKSTPTGSRKLPSSGQGRATPREGAYQIRVVAAS